MPKQRLGTVAVIQLSLFLTTTLAAVIGGAWTNVVQSDFGVDAAVAAVKTALTTDAGGDSGGVAAAVPWVTAATSNKSKKLRYALLVTLGGLCIIVAWTLLVQELNPDIITAWEPIPQKVTAH